MQTVWALFGVELNMEPDKHPCGNKLIDDALQGSLTQGEKTFLGAIMAVWIAIVIGIFKLIF